MSWFEGLVDELLMLFWAADGNIDKEVLELVFERAEICEEGGAGWLRRLWAGRFNQL